MKDTAYILIPLGLIYFFGCFIAMNFNPYHWPIVLRIVVVVFVVYVLTLALDDGEGDELTMK